MQRHPELRTCSKCHRELDKYVDRVLLIPGSEGNAREIALVCASRCVGQYGNHEGELPQESARLIGTPREVITAYWERIRQSVKPVRGKDYVLAPTKTLEREAVDASRQTSSPDIITELLNRPTTPLSYKGFRRRF